MNRGIAIKSALGAGVAVSVFAPAAAAHHSSEPYCYWGRDVLPRGDALEVAVERNHFMQNECEGTTVTVRTADGRAYAVRTTSREEREQATRHSSREPSARDSSKAAKRSKPARKCRQRGKKRCR